MTTRSMTCPQCGGGDVHFRQVRSDWICDVCEYAWRAEAPIAKEPKAKLFLSYGRRDARELADRLRRDLEARGYEVWQDARQIRSGREWEQEIVDGLRSTQLVMALLSPHAVRVAKDPANPDSVDSVCLDEISFARFATPTRPIVPVMAVPCEPPLCIFRLDYVDLTQWQASEDQYRAGLARVLESIEAALHGQVRYRAWDQQLRPLDFAAFLNEKRRDFCGRQWLFDEIDAWRVTSPDRALLITGDPGTGKSAVVAELVHRNPGGQVLAYHLCRADTEETLKPGQFVRSVAAMIASKWPDYAAQLSNPEIADVLSEARADSDPGRALEMGVLTPLESCPAPDDGPRYIIIDALDEALSRGGAQATIVDLLASRLERLPGWLRLVATTRKDRGVLSRLRGLRARELDAHDQRNLDDINAYIHQRLRGPNLAERLTASGLTPESAARSLREKAAGLFLYIQQVLQGIERDLYGFQNLDSLPPGLFGLYLRYFERHFRDEAAFAPVRLVLEVIVAAREPLTEEQLAQATGLDADAALPTALRQLSGYLSEREGHFAVFHKSFRDWLTHPESRGEWHHIRTSQGHARLAAMCWREYQQGSKAPFVLRHLPAHLAESGRWDDLAHVLADLGFLEAKAEAGWIFDLAGDFVQAVARLPAAQPSLPMLRLLDETLRADIHFLARHPACLFQCLWNRGWWHDCSEAAKHYDPPEHGWPAGIAPWDRPGRKLSELLEQWRRAKATANKGFRWLRSVRPPAQPLETAQQAVFRGHEGIVSSVAFSPDGATIASGSKDHQIRLWNVANGALIGLLQGHRDAVHGLAFSPDGKLLASASLDQTARVWDVATGEELVCFQEHGDWVRRVVFSPDGQWVASGAEDWTVRVWESASGKMTACLQGHGGGISSLAFSPDGRSILSGASDGDVRLWDRSTGRQKFWLQVADGGIRRAAFAPDGQSFLTATSTGLSQQWDAASGRLIATFPCKFPRLWSAEFSPDCRYLVGGFQDRSVRIWDLAGQCETAAFHGHEDRVFSVTYSPDGKRIASGGWEGAVRIWDIDRNLSRPVLHDHAKAIRALAFAPDGRCLVTGGEDNALRVWSLPDAALLKLIPCPDLVRALAFSPDGRQFAAGLESGMVRIWEQAAAEPPRLLEGHLGAVLCLAYSPDGLRLATGSWDESIRVWDPATGMELACLRGHQDRVLQVMFTEEGREVLSSSGDGTVRRWNAASGELLQTLEDQAARDCLQMFRAPAAATAVVESFETAIQNSVAGQPLAWWPAKMSLIHKDLRQNTWAGALLNHLVVFTLEGPP